jgi:hypothetical protein
MQGPRGDSVTPVNGSHAALTATWPRMVCSEAERGPERYWRPAWLRPVHERGAGSLTRLHRTGTHTEREREREKRRGGEVCVMVVVGGERGGDVGAITAC